MESRASDLEDPRNKSKRATGRGERKVEMSAGGQQRAEIFVSNDQELGCGRAAVGDLVMLPQPFQHFLPHPLSL